MNLHTDIPTRAQVDRLLESRDRASVSIFVPTDPASDGQAEQIELGNLAAEALRQLTEGAATSADVAAVEESIADVVSDAVFWRYQARSLALFVTPASLMTFRLPNRLVGLVEVSDRFHLKPLLRALTFPQVAFVLALAQGSVRVIEVAPDVDPTEIGIPDLPRDVGSAVGKSSIADRSPSGRLQGSEGQKVRMRQYARQIDLALRPFLGGRDVPLILAAAEPMDSVYRSINTYPHLAPTSLSGNPEALSDGELVAAARGVLDEIYATELVRVQELYARRSSEGRAASDVVDVARAATFGAVDTVFADIDQVVPGTVDEASGVVTFAEGDDSVTYGVVDEIVRRVWLSGGRVLAVRREDVPGNGSVAAILRYAI